MRNGGCCLGRIVVPAFMRVTLRFRFCPARWRGRPVAPGPHGRRHMTRHPPPADADAPATLGACRRCALWGMTQPVPAPAPSTRRSCWSASSRATRRTARDCRSSARPGMLDRALGEAGIERAHCYLTNAVKHFKWEPRGKRGCTRRPRNARWPRAATGSNANSMRYGRASSSRSAAPRCARCCKTTMRRSRRARADSHGARPARRRHLSPVVRAAHARRRFARACVPEARRRVAHRIAPYGEPDRDGDLDRDNRHGARGGTR